MIIVFWPELKVPTPKAIALVCKAWVKKLAFSFLRTRPQARQNLFVFFMISLHFVWVAELHAQQNSDQVVQGLAGSTAGLPAAAPTGNAVSGSDPSPRGDSGGPNATPSLSASAPILNSLADSSQVFSGVTLSGVQITIPGATWLQAFADSANALNPVSPSAAPFLADLSASTLGFPGTSSANQATPRIVASAAGRALVVDRVLSALGLTPEMVEKLSDEERQGLEDAVLKEIHGKQIADLSTTDFENMAQAIQSHLQDRLEANPAEALPEALKLLAQQSDTTSLAKTLETSLGEIVSDPVTSALNVEVASAEPTIPIEVPSGPLNSEAGGGGDGSSGEVPLADSDDKPLAFGAQPQAGAPVVWPAVSPKPGEFVDESKVANASKQPEQRLPTPEITRLSDLPPIAAPSGQSSRSESSPPVGGRGLASSGDIRGVTDPGSHATTTTNPLPPPPASNPSPSSAPNSVASAAKGNGGGAPMNSSNFDSFFVQPSQGAARSTPGVSSSVSHFSNTNPTNVMVNGRIPVSAPASPVDLAKQFSCRDPEPPGERQLLEREFEKALGSKRSKTQSQKIALINKQRADALKSITDHFSDLYKPGGKREFTTVSRETNEVFEAFLSEYSILEAAQPYLRTVFQENTPICEEPEGGRRSKTTVLGGSVTTVAGRCMVGAAHRLMIVNGVRLSSPPPGQNFSETKKSWIAELQKPVSGGGAGLDPKQASTAIDAALNTAAISGLVAMNPELGPKLMANTFSLFNQMRLKPQHWQCAYTPGVCSKDCFQQTGCTQAIDPSNPTASRARIAQLNSFVDSLSDFQMVSPNQFEAYFSQPDSKVAEWMKEAALFANGLEHKLNKPRLYQNISGNNFEPGSHLSGSGFGSGSGNLIRAFLGPDAQGEDSSPMKTTLSKAIKECTGPNQWGSVIAELEVYYRNLAKKLCSKDQVTRQLYVQSDAALIEGQFGGSRENTLFESNDVSIIKAKNESLLDKSLRYSDLGAGTNSCATALTRHSTYLTLANSSSQSRAGWVATLKDADSRLLRRLSNEAPPARTPSGH